MSDLISRSALIEKIEERIQSGIFHGASYYMLERFKVMVRDAPAVEAKPVVRGKWESTRDENKKRCSVCGIIHLIAQYPRGNANFCPNCGADMRGGKNE